jgi:UDP-hydrolysing UDP-N-acetyl-D-glucosamine 2-epimerase
MKKTICVTLTNRTNYSKLKTVLFEISKYKKINFYLVLSSSILLERYGSGYKDLEKDGFEIDKKIDCVLMNDSHEAMAKTIGISVIEHATYFASRKPDLLLIVGDRFDMLAPVVAAGTMNIPIAHIQGGELSGTIDNVIRDVLTKFSSLHFVATENSMQNLIDYGVKKETVFNYGCPAVEYITKLDVGTSFDPARISKKFKYPIQVDKDEKYFLVMVHPDTTDENDVEMSKVLEVVSRFALKTFIFYPNIDANNTEIVSSIARYNNNDSFFMIRHMPLEDFVYTMAHCVCMIGNSSSGIRESASFATPFINIGERQIGRERNKNTIDIGDDYDSLESTIKSCMNLKLRTDNIYYKDGCSNRIAAKIVDYISIEK